MSDLQKATDGCAGLSVHVSCQPAQQPQSPKIQSSDAYCKDPALEKATTTSPPPPPPPPQLCPDSSFPFSPEAGVFTDLDNRILALNRSLQDHQGKAADAQAFLLKDLRKFCEALVQQLTEDFALSETQLRALMKKPATRKTQKKAVRMWDQDLQAVNRQVHVIRQVKDQVEDRLRLLAGPGKPDPEHQPLSPIPTTAELLSTSAAERRRALAGKNGFCKEMMLCLLLSLLMFVLTLTLMKYLRF